MINILKKPTKLEMINPSEICVKKHNNKNKITLILFFIYLK